MTRDNKDSFKSFLDDIFTVYKQADKSLNILSKSSLPTDFYEPGPNNIVPSYIRYIKGHSKFETTDILTKYNNNEYDSPYQIYHDIKTVCVSEIQKYKVGSKLYKEIDFFYKFSTELLLRETNRLNVILFGEEKKAEEPSEVESQLNEDFNKISVSYNVTNGEVITFTSKTQDVNPYAHSYPNLYQAHAPQILQNKQPLFSSLTGKSVLDPRETIVPGKYQLAKVIPQSKNVTRNISNLDNLSPSISKIPSPMTQPTQILKDYFHPNWYTIYVPTWLNYKSKVLKPPISSSLLKDQHELDLRLVSRPAESFKSFAPTSDSKRAIVTQELKGNVWLNHLGYKKINEINNQYRGDIEMNIDSKPDTDAEKSSEDTKPTTASEGEDIEMKDMDDIKSEEFSKSNLRKEINIAHLVQWDPEKIEKFESIKKEKESILKSPRELQRLISINLLRLNKLRQERYLSSNPQNLLVPNNIEVKLYNKIVKLITLSIELNNVTSEKLSINFSKKLPVLTTEYSGTLPGIPPSKTPVGAKSTRLPSIRGPYKKKNRQL